jgi:hypothetical protein
LPTRSMESVLPSGRSRDCRWCPTRRGGVRW